MLETHRGYQKRLRPKQIRARKRKQEALEEANFQYVIQTGSKFIENWQPTTIKSPDQESKPTSSKQFRQSETCSSLIADISQPIAETPSSINPPPSATTKTDVSARNHSSEYFPEFKPHPGYSKWYESQFRPEWELPCFKNFKVLCIGDSHLES